MGSEPDRLGDLVLETERLLLRPWRVPEAAIRRELWIERDPRVPAHRRIDASGHPTIAEIEESIRGASASSVGLLAIERKDHRDVIGSCGLVAGEGGREGQPELAYELLRTFWGLGYATEASRAVLGWARAAGYKHISATVWDWNLGSRRVLEKLGFAVVGSAEEGRGVSLSVTTQL